jgi:hypothetical protein
MGGLGRLLFVGLTVGDRQMASGRGTPQPGQRPSQGLATPALAAPCHWRRRKGALLLESSRSPPILRDCSVEVLIAIHMPVSYPRLAGDKLAQGAGQNWLGQGVVVVMPDAGCWVVPLSDCSTDAGGRVREF